MPSRRRHRPRVLPIEPLESLSSDRSFHSFVTARPYHCNEPAFFALNDSRRLVGTASLLQLDCQNQAAAKSIVHAKIFTRNNAQDLFRTRLARGYLEQGRATNFQHPFVDRL